jgi:hypothetical protein
MLAVARTWLSGSTTAYLGVAAYSLPVVFTWPILDAAFSRYTRQPLVNAPAKTRLPWVACVLVGIFASILIGGFSGT